MAQGYDVRHDHAAEHMDAAAPNPLYATADEQHTDGVSGAAEDGADGEQDQRYGEADGAAEDIAHRGHDGHHDRVD